MTSKEIRMKYLPVSVKSAAFVFIFLIPAWCRAVEVNCSEPNQPALLKALAPVFDLKAIRPVVNVTTITNVSTFFTLYGILGVDEKAQLLVTYIWWHYSWTNEFVSWDPIQCGTNKISLPRDKLWVPDIVIKEFMAENTAPPVPYVYLFSNGLVHDAQPVRVVSSCQLDINIFPFDIQNCTLTFSSYLHLASDLRVYLARSEENITELSKMVMTTMGEWELLDITAHKPTGGSEERPIDELAFHIRVRRQSISYVVNLLLPSTLLVVVDVFSFLLPPHSVDRSSFKMTLILGYTVFLLIMNDMLPITGSSIPLINVFLSLYLGLMVISLIETIIITNMVTGSSSPVPRWVRVIVLQVLGVLVFLPQKTKEPKSSDVRLSAVAAQQVAEEGPPKETEPADESKHHQELRSMSMDLRAIRLQVEQQLGGRTNSEEWVQVGLILDRLLFFFYIVSLALSDLSFNVIWKKNL